MAFDHFIHYDEARREIVIYRVEPDGRRHLYTQAPFPKTKGWDEVVDQFAQELGENLLMDSAVARKLMEL